MLISITEDIKSVSEFKKNTHQKTTNLEILLSEAEHEVKRGFTRSARKFLKEFKKCKCLVKYKL